jgi:hypothetical protein
VAIETAFNVLLEGLHSSESMNVQNDQYNMYPDLISAPLDTPLFIRHIDSPLLSDICSRLGLEEGVKITIKNRYIPVYPVWVQLESSRVIICPSLACALVITATNEKSYSLSLLNTEQEGYVKTVLSEDGDWDRLLHKLEVAEGAHLKKIRSLKPYDFIFETNHGKIIRLSLDETTRIMGSVSGNKSQLASIQVGQRFVVESILFNDSSKEKGYNKIHRGQTLTLRQLVPQADSEPANTSVYIEADHSHVCLKTSSAKKIRVGICEICWSCGECANLL